jgi:hypothetical protein
MNSLWYSPAQYGRYTSTECARTYYSPYVDRRLVSCAWSIDSTNELPLPTTHYPRRSPNVQVSCKAPSRPCTESSFSSVDSAIEIALRSHPRELFALLLRLVPSALTSATYKNSK